MHPVNHGTRHGYVSRADSCDIEFAMPKAARRSLMVSNNDEFARRLLFAVFGDE